MDQIAVWITRVFENNDNETLLNGIKDEVRELCNNFPNLQS